MTNSPAAEPDRTSSQLPDQAPTDQEQAEPRLVRWLKARRWDADFWLHYTLFPWLRTTARPWASRRLGEIGLALDEGWYGACAWIRAVLYAVGTLIGLLLLGLIGVAASGFWQHTMIGTHHHGVLATVTGPVHAYITAHAAGLPTDPGTVWALWQLAGPVLLLLAATGQIAARLAWCGYGAATASAVWMATPDPGRPVALALTVAAWALGSTVALYGMRLRPLVIFNRPRAAGRRSRPTGTGTSTRTTRAVLPSAEADRGKEPDVW